MWGEGCWEEEISHLLLGVITYNVRARIGGESALSSYEFACLFGSLGDFSLPLHRKRNERPSGDAGSLTFKRSLR